MKTVIIYLSSHHGNTEKVAKAFAETIDADLKTVSEVNPASLSEYSVFGFGSGIFYGKHRKELLELVEKLPQTTLKAFIFSTTGEKNPKTITKYHTALRDAIAAKGFEIIGEFNCPGWDTVGPFKLVGGLNKGRPNDEDLAKARDFARSLKT
jgi:flavodoxin